MGEHAGKRRREGQLSKHYPGKRAGARKVREDAIQQYGCDGRGERESANWETKSYKKSQAGD